jgi:CBS domain-containing protein
MTNSDAFLSAFADIETSLRDRLAARNGMPFSQLVREAANVSAEVRRYESDLREFAELRNAIVHDRGGGRIIAEPHEAAVQELRAIASVVTRPPTVARFLTTVITVGETAPVSYAAKLIADHSFSQLPVLRGTEFIGLLTAATIARWLGSRAGDQCAPHQETSVLLAMEHAEDPEPYVFISPDTSLARVLEHFAEFEAVGRELAALLIRNADEPSTPLGGIITVSDLPAVLRALPDLLGPGTNDR